MKSVYFGGGGLAQGTAGASGDEDEVIFPPSASGFLRLTNKSGGIAAMTISVTYREFDA